ncbi:hypothetical protein PUN28_017616 [Cardiocondyla obscurior]
MNRADDNVMYTPRTPRMRQRQQFALNAPPETEEDFTGLKGLVGQWNIYAVSALFGFQSDDLQLKRYSKKLREEIASTLPHENVSYEAKVLVMNDAYGLNKDHPAIKIEIVTTTNIEDSEKIIYRGILLSWSTAHNYSSIQNSIRLPLLLCRGTQSCMNAAHDIIGRMFDCQIVALPANEHDLNWLIPIIIMATDKEEQPILSGEVRMEYVVPELPVSDTITVTFDVVHLRKILLTIINDEVEETSVSLDHEHIEMFYEVLHQQMLAVGNLQLGLCMLRKIQLPGITIIENKMKVMNVDIMNNVLLYFSDKALDLFHTMHIDI